jgi:hypothetical protein
MIYQFYIMEIQQYADGSYGDIKHFVYDEDADKARLKGESKFYEVLAAAAVSNLPSHAAIMFSSDGFPIMHQCYKHEVTPEPTPEPESEPETPDEEE